METCFIFWTMVGAIFIVTATEMKLTLLPKGTKGGLCLDGTPAGAYYSPPPSGSSNLWVIYIKGGGYCGNEASCMQRANTSLGSSNYWNNTINTDDIEQGGVLSDDPNMNPDFYTGHHVFAPYCSADVWTGQRTEPNEWGLYFSGHLIFGHIIEYLGDNVNVWEAEYVLLTGGSSGGIGTFHNLDWLRNEFAEKGTNKNVKVKGAPVAGWFWPGNTTDQNDTMMPPNDFPHWINHTNGGIGHDNSMVILYDAYLNPACVSGLGSNLSWQCGSTHNLYKYITSPIFVMENKYDCDTFIEGMQMPEPWVTINKSTTGYVEYYGTDTDRSVIPQIIDEKNTQNGLFYASCFAHTAGMGIGVDTFSLNHGKNVTIINGYNSSELVADWFWERNKLPHYVYDTCNDATNKLPCNPTCNSYAANARPCM